MADGLSDLNFMTGAMQGFGFVEGVVNNDKAQKRADRQVGLAEAAGQRQQEQHDFTMGKNQKAERDKALQKRLRASAETGSPLDAGFFSEYPEFNILSSSDKREELMQAGTLMHRAVANNQWDEKALDGVNLILKDDLAKRTKKDGLGRRVIGVKEVPTGRDADGDGVEDVRMVPILEVTEKDGTKRRAPLTKQGGAGLDEDIYTVNDAKIDEWHQAALQRANMAYLFEKAGDDPKAQANVLHRIAFGADIYPGKKGDFTFKQIWDDKTGTKRAAALNNKTGKFSHWVGGAEDPSKTKKGSGKSSTDKQNELFWEQVDRYQGDISTAIENGDDAAIPQLKQSFKNTYGFDFDQVGIAQSALLNSGQSRRVGVQDMLDWTQEQQVVDQDAAVDQVIANNQELFSPGLASAAGEQVATAPPPPSENSQKIAELESKAMDPKYPQNARDKFTAEAESLKAKNNVNRRAAPKPMSPREKRQREIDHINQQIANASSPLEAAPLTQKLVELMAEQNSPQGADAQRLASF